MHLTYCFRMLLLTFYCSEAQTRTLLQQRARERMTDYWYCFKRLASNGTEQNCFSPPSDVIDLISMFQTYLWPGKYKCKMGLRQDQFRDRWLCQKSSHMFFSVQPLCLCD